jgi:hypothetical protein
LSLSGCAKCWDTPCTCGWDYRHWGVDNLEEHIQILQKILQYKRENPNVIFSGICEKDTDGDKDLMNFLYKK